MQVAAQQLLVLAQALTQEGFDCQALARGAGIESAEQIRARPWRSASELDQLMRACQAFSGDEGFGLEVAGSYAQLRHGTIAVLAMHAPSLRTALDDLGRFFPIVQDGRELSYTVDNGICTVQFQPIGLTPATRRFRAEQTMGGLLILARLFGLADEEVLEVHFEHQRPAYVQRYADVFGNPLHFDQAASMIVFRAAVLDRERIDSDAAAYSMAKAAAVAELAAVNQRHSTAELVRRAIRELGFRKAGLQQVASAMGMGERTLRRQLSKDGVSFQLIYDAVRLEEAKKFIGTGHVPLKQVAEHTGFESVGNFHRAFKRLTGLTPAQWRRSLGAPQSAAPGSSDLPA